MGGDGVFCAGRGALRGRGPRRGRLEEPCPAATARDVSAVSLQSGALFLSLSLSLSLFEPMRLYGDGIFNHEQKMALLDQKIAMLKGPGGSQGGGSGGPHVGQLRAQKFEEQKGRADLITTKLLSGNARRGRQRGACNACAQSEAH